MFTVQLAAPADAGRLPLDRARQALLERSEWLQRVLAEAGPDLDASTVSSVPVAIESGADLAAVIQQVSAEVDALADRVNQLTLAESAAARAADLVRRLQPVTQPEPAQVRERLSIGQIVAESVQALAGRPGTIMADCPDPLGAIIGQATLTTTGAPPDVTRSGVVATFPTEPIRIVDVIPAIQTTQSAFVYLEETTFTNAAAERNEAAVYAEAALAYTERSVPIRSVGVRLPVTDEALSDFTGLRQIVDGRLRYMLQARLDSQIINGNGTAPNLLGTLNVSGIQTQARGTDTHLDAILKAITRVRATGKAEPSVIILSPADWQTVRLAKTSDGAYLIGPPIDQGVSRLWGVPVVASDVLAQGTGIVGDYARHAALVTHTGIEVQVGLNADDFSTGRQTVRAGMRCAVVHYRPSAFCTVTGL